MNIYNVSNTELDNLPVYQEFLKNNEGIGYLRISAFGASEAVPIDGMNIEVSTILEDNSKIIFFDGKTDSSGMINRIMLPAPKVGSDNMIAPKTIVYNIKANYEGIEENFKVNLYDGIRVIQIINIIPNNIVRGISYGN